MASKVGSGFTSVATLGAVVLAKKGLDRSWRAATGKRPPANPADPDVELKDALIWAMFSAAGITVVRSLAARRAANYVARSTAPRT